MFECKRHHFFHSEFQVARITPEGVGGVEGMLILLQRNKAMALKPKNIKVPIKSVIQSNGMFSLSYLLIFIPF